MNYEGPRFDALRNAIYHSARKAFFDRWNRFLSFVIVLAGAAAIADFSATLGLSRPTLFAALATAAAAIQLVGDLGGRAAKHDYLQRRYYEFLADMQEHPDVKSDPKWEARLTKLYADEPPPRRALDAIAYNAACEAIGAPSDKRVKVSWLQSLLRNWLFFNKAHFPYDDGDGKAASSSA